VPLFGRKREDDEHAGPPAERSEPDPSAPEAEPEVRKPEHPAAGGPPSAGSMRGVPLGTLVYRSGLVSLDHLQSALKDSVVSGRRLGEVLVSSGALSPADLARLLAGQKGLVFLEEVPSRDPQAAALLELARARDIGAVPIGFEGGRPLVVVSDPSEAVARVRAALGQEIRVAVVSPETLARLLSPEAAPPPPPPAPPPPAPPRANRAVVVLRIHGGQQVDLAAYASRDQAESVAEEARRRLGAGERIRLGDRVLDGSMVAAVEVSERAAPG